jgi:hypothetical protein
VLVIDANVAIAACARPSGFEDLRDELAAPPLLWSEARSTLHLQAAKGEIDAARAELLHKRLNQALIKRGASTRRTLAKKPGASPMNSAGVGLTTPSTWLWRKSLAAAS